MWNDRQEADSWLYIVTILQCYNVASNLVYHECTNHIKVYFHFNKEKVSRKEIQLEHSCTENHITDFLTKVVTNQRLCDVSSKLGKEA